MFRAFGGGWRYFGCHRSIFLAKFLTLIYEPWGRVTYFSFTYQDLFPEMSGGIFLRRFLIYADVDSPCCWVNIEPTKTFYDRFISTFPLSSICTVVNVFHPGCCKWRKCRLRQPNFSILKLCWCGSKEPKWLWSIEVWDGIFETPQSAQLL